MLTEEEDASDEVLCRRREEAVRRSQLYGISSKRHLPAVLTTPHDARIRRELQLLFTPEPRVLHNGLSAFEDELEQRKHAGHLGCRPALDQSHPLQDLYTTVPKQVLHRSEHELPPNNAATHTREWRLGYTNDPQSDFHGAAMRGVFEPTDTVRERILQADGYKATSTAVAYPVPRTSSDQVVQQLQPFDGDQARKDMEMKLRAGMVSDNASMNCLSPSKSAKQKHWSPASHATLGLHKQAAKRKQKQTPAIKIDQRFAVRQVHSPLKKVGLEIETNCLQRQQALSQQLNASYAQVQQHAKQQTDPTVRYSLPIENPKYERAYRLGLEPVASSFCSPSRSQPQPAALRPEDDTGDAFGCPLTQPGKTPRKARAKAAPPLLFRPKSAVSLRMDTTLGTMPLLPRSASSTSLLRKADALGKVAGAKRRPHSASVNYLSHSTVYLMDPRGEVGDNNPTLASETVVSHDAHQVLHEQKKYGAPFLSVLLEERTRRQQTHSQQLQALARRGVLHTIPTPQIFARLRREALKNLTKRVEQTRYEKLPLEDYMSLCGMAVVPGTPSKQRYEELQDNDPTSDDDDDEEELVAKPVPNHRDEDDEPATVRALRDQAELRNLPFDEPVSTCVVFRKRKSLRPDPASGNNSSTIQAMRRALVVRREQFHIALEAFAVATRDVNVLYSALDVNVADAVAVWEIVCAVERLQDGHEELRRARVQVKSGHLPKDLDTLRQSVSIPHQTHVPMPLA